jgi:hypothetical protein
VRAARGGSARVHVVRAFDLHGVRITVEADPVVVAALETRFARFPRANMAASDLTITYRAVADAAHHVVSPPPSTARSVYRSPAGDVVCYDDEGDRLSIVRGDRLRLQYEPARGRAVVSVVETAVESRLLAHALPTLVLMEALRRRGRYGLHAAAVALDGKGLLLAGDGGTGKSTMALALARAGFGFLADDLVFLTHDEHGLCLLACPEPADCTPRTARLFPELADLVAAPLPAGSLKHQVQVPERFAAPVVWTCRPAAVIFPQVGSTPHSALTPLRREEAYRELAAGVLLTASAWVRAHLDACAALVRACPCYRLETGRELDVLPALLRGVLA